jgi:hypothetical protein
MSVTHRVTRLGGSSAIKQLRHQDSAVSLPLPRILNTVTGTEPTEPRRRFNVQRSTVNSRIILRTGQMAGKKDTGNSMIMIYSVQRLQARSSPSPLSPLSSFTNTQHRRSISSFTKTTTESSQQTHLLSNPSTGATRQTKNIHIMYSFQFDSSSNSGSFIACNNSKFETRRDETR